MARVEELLEHYSEYLTNIKHGTTGKTKVARHVLNFGPLADNKG